MGTLLGILLIELKVFGISLRTPLLSFLTVGKKLWGELLLAGLVCIAYAGIFLDSLISFSKVNILTFVLIVFGFWVMFRLSISKNHTNKHLQSIIKILPIFFLLLVILQIIGLGFWIPAFGENVLNFYPRTSGLSSEPSFFANMVFFTLILYIGCCRKNRYLYCLIFSLIFLSTASFSLIIYLILLVCIKIVFKLKVGSLKPTPLFILLLVPLSLVMVERGFYTIADASLTHELFKYNPSWREISLFSSIYGANIIGPFSGGEYWGEILITGQSTMVKNDELMTWIVWPWSLFSMLLCELGVIPTFLLIIFIGYRLNIIWFRQRQLRSHLKWYTVSICIGMFLAPKWCVYFFFYPIYMNPNYKKNLLRYLQ